MANEEHVKIVRRGTDAIQKFRDANEYVYFHLSGADLSGANLSGASLTCASLGRADLSGADLNHADLNHADLSCANLSCANLSGANLSAANLRDANLSGANLRDANLISADLGPTVFANVDLSQVNGLETVNHHGPSTIGVDTLFLSNGKIPEIFLRGCGMRETLITYLPSFMENAFDFYSCFISHNKTDKPFARQLHDRLQGRGIRCWLDEKDLNPGDDLYDGIDRGIRVWDKVLLCASKDSLVSGWVDDEITIALEKEKELLKSTQKKLLKIVPLNLDGYMFSDDWQSGYRAMIRKRVAADFTTWKSDADEFERQFERVVKALRTDGGKLPEPPSKLK